MQRILITGSHGQVGWELARRLAGGATVLALDRTALDLADARAIRSAVGQWKPTVVINAAAYTAVDAAESDPEACRAINATAPAVLADAARHAGALMIHFSTDYVFDGSKDSPYMESDPTNPLGEYGRTKLDGETGVAEAGADYMTFRLCWVYSCRGRNFFKTIRRLAGERDSLRVVADQTGSPTWAGTIAGAVCEALAVRLRAEDPESFNGTYHLACTGQTTWHGFAQAIVDGMDRPRCTTVEPISTAEYPTPARRPAYSVLCPEKFERTFGVTLPDWPAALDEMLRREEVSCS